MHLAPAVAGPERWMATHLATRSVRRREIDAYLTRLAGGVPALVAGDFNEMPEGDLFGSLRAAGFESALPNAGETGATWRWAGVDPPLEAQLDHVAYAASAFELVSARVVPGGNSDHRAVVVTLRRR